MFIWLPFPNADGPWSLSQTFSILHGDFFKNQFAASYISFYNMPYMYNLLMVPFYAADIFGEYQQFIVNIILVLLLILQVWIYFKRKNETSWLLSLFFSLAIVASPYSYNQRTEITSLCIIFLLISILYKNGFAKKRNVAAAALLIAVVGLAHPVAGIFAVALVSLMAYDTRVEFKNFILLGALAFLLLMILYAPFVAMDVQSFYTSFFERGFANDDRGVALLTLSKYFLYSPLTFLLTFYLFYYRYKTSGLLKEIIYFVISVLVLLIFARSYYFPYLLGFLFWRYGDVKLIFPEGNRHCVILISTCVVVVSIFITHIWPTIQNLENQKYIRNWKRILNQTELIFAETPNNLVWTSPFLGALSIWHENARMHFRYYKTYVGQSPEMKKGDIFLAENDETLKYVANLCQDHRYKISELVLPVNGLVTISYPFKRSTSIGLWKITIE